MEVIYLYLAFSYLFMMIYIGHSSDPGIIKVISFIISPLAMPMLIGYYHGRHDHE